MGALGLIAEYNPFHNGHAYHLKEAKRLSSSDGTICVMSGNFIQRGEPAIVNKWARTRMALDSGIDLVIELPVVYAMSSAEYFAYGAVKILDSLGIVGHICFGSENGKLEELEVIAGVLSSEPEKFKDALKYFLKKGYSYPAARQEALYEYLCQTPAIIKNEFWVQKENSRENQSGLFRSPNNILGVEYLKALKKLKSSIAPLTIPRIVNDYGQAALSGSISSATSIRRHICNEEYGLNALGVLDALPESSRKVLKQEFEAGRGPVNVDNYSDILLALLRKMDPEQIGELPYVTEGLENRIKKASEGDGGIEGLIDRIQTRRYTRTRIQRILLHLLTGLTAKEFDEFNRNGGPQYARVLGFNGKGRELLRDLKQKSKIPIILKPADYQNSCNPMIRRMIQIEALSTDMYVLGYENRKHNVSGQEFTNNIVRIN